MKEKHQIQSILKRIKNMRYDKGLTQENMAGMMGISQNAYYKLENGITNLSLENFLRISSILNTDLLLLLEGNEKEYVFKDFYVKKKEF
jgi:transcriptional regulator with XRE-family HTH domain